jgi:anti-repressor protein
MSQLVLTNQKGQDVTTSLIVAEVFEKNHADVLRDIRNLHCSEDFRLRNFAECLNVIELPVGSSRQPYYEMTKDGFSFLVMGYTGEKAANFKEKFIAEFNKRDALLKNEDYIINRAMEVLAGRTKALEETNKKLEEVSQQQARALQDAAPKVLFADSVMTSEQSVLIRDLAKILRQNGILIGQNRLFKWLRDNHYLLLWGESYNQPSQKAMELGLFEIKKNVINQPDGTIFVTETTKVSPKGQIYFVNKFLNGANA